MLFWVLIAAVGLIAVLGWTLYVHVGATRLEAFAARRRPTSRIVSNGEFVDGSRHMKVAMALTSTDLFYENADMEASIDLRWVSEVEYDTCLATGHDVGDGKVLRLRCFSQVFEFILPREAVSRWNVTLPPHRRIESSTEGTTLVAPVTAAT